MPTSRDLVVSTTTNRVTTLTMTMPRRLNGWTFEMMAALREGIARAVADDDTAVIVLTGTDPYYSAGVNLGATLKLGHPAALHAQIVEHNQALFDLFLDIPKPILAAVNGPAIGASVTSATLCDAIVASEEATFSTPFARLGVPPEGCSSVLFERLIGDAAERMLGPEGWVPTGTEAADIGLADGVVAHGDLMAEAQGIAEGWVADGRTRTFRGGMDRETLKAVNAAESVQVATAFLSRPFLRGQRDFLWRKKKRGPAAMFFALWATQPLWGWMVPRE